MPSLVSIASQLSSAQEAASASGTGAGLAAQASASFSSVAGALSSGTERARSGLAGLAGGAAPFGRNLLGGGAKGGGGAAAIPSDGTRCEQCGEVFGVLTRRTTCGSCNRFLCPMCMGRNPMAAMVGFSCFCGAMCTQCREQDAHTGEFALCRSAMESGAGVRLTLPSKPPSSAGGFFSAVAASAAGPRQLSAWLTVDAKAAELRWATLEQRQGRPVEEGQVPIAEVLGVRNTGMVLELSVQGYAKPYVLDFSTAEERTDWARYLELAIQVLVPESERAEYNAARASHRHMELEERRALNEERRKKLSEGLGMRFTAEAMMTRNDAKSASAPRGG